MEHLQKQNILEFHRRMRGTPGWELLEEPGLTATRTPAGEALGNDVWAPVTAENLARARRFFQGQPFCWLVEEGQGTGLLEAAGGTFREPDLEMVVPLPGRPQASGVTEVRGAQELEEVYEVLAEVFGFRAGTARGFFGPLVRTAGWVPFLVREEGQPAATAMVFPAQEAAGIYAVATRPAFRRRGRAAAVVSACLGRAGAMGCRQAVLYATPAGEPLYRGLGFRTVAVFRDWFLPA